MVRMILLISFVALASSQINPKCGEPCYWEGACKGLPTCTECLPFDRHNNVCKPKPSVADAGNANVTLVGTAAGMSCPSTPAFGPAAGMKISTVAATSCDKVEAEIKARVTGQSSTKRDEAWHDPHNNGKYTLENYGGTVSTSRLTGNGKYTDKQIFTLTPDGDNCKIDACSRSQVTSVLDMGTNYCDLKMLFCGKADGCKPLFNDFTVGTETTEKFAGASVDLKSCLVDQVQSGYCRSCANDVDCEDRYGGGTCHICGKDDNSPGCLECKPWFTSEPGYCVFKTTQVLV